MNGITEYFARRAHQPRFHLGDRVFGYYNKIPFVGRVGAERIVSSSRGPEVSVMLYLPIENEGQQLKIITVKPDDLKPLVSIDETDKPRRKR